MTTAVSSSTGVNLATVTFRGRALGWRFAITGLPALVKPVAEALAGLSSDAMNDHRYDLIASDDGCCTVRFDGALLLERLRLGALLPNLAWHINQQAIAHGPGGVLLHAGAVALGRRGVVVAGPSGSGKSTLVAGLVARGWTYLADEVTAIHPDQGHIVPYRKPISLRRGSWPQFARLCDFDPSYELDEIDVPPAWLGPTDTAEVERTVPHTIVFVRFEAGAGANLRVMRRAEAVTALAVDAHTLGVSPRRGMEALSHLTSNAQCLELTYGTVAAACDVLTDALQTR